MTKPEYFSHEEFVNRTQKLNELRELGIDPYPHHYSPTHPIEDLHKSYEKESVGTSEDAEQEKTDSVRVAGRLVLFRSMGKNAFGQVQDQEARIQVMFNRDHTLIAGYSPDSQVPGSLTPLKLLEKKIDLGDIIGVEGYLFRTGKGELTIYAKTVTILCKALLPLPDKHSGLADKELRYRKRWLDLISHQEVKKVFLLRSKIIGILRKHLEESGFLEVETHVLQKEYGGANARPFTTVLNALDQQMYLRISLEPSLKKLIVGGIERVFEISKVFRNEGIDRTHNPEFTMMECYASYWDYNDMMRFMETLFERIALEVYGKTQIAYGADAQGNDLFLEMKAPWPRLTMKDAIRQYARIDVDNMSDDELREKLLEYGKHAPTKVKALPRGLLISDLFEEGASAQLIQPHFIIDFPIETTPLCKLHRDPKDREEGIVERFEAYIAGQEICNAYSELNDPLLQRELLEEQSDKRAAGDEEAMPLDEEFLEAICQGMPPAGGLGIGVDRLVMFFTNAQSIRDVIYFPWMK